ncbi:hypothetical protein AMAG_16521 [Allomyces macrogynus ATCC 38327]|uniref:Globin family profile domain-containing protein n=1 Tax=Allomyces macrogynus (strain ATCC 38327) TaxID=578462 RepID=A0A0L0TCS8_ALLM3|nr:hypothetical protein AMAG_16521 [Allomyces macrogynus ATCC 38327]|eukprot:KNE72476.1 hypothetical protein AMAG_16521 [Allomyces macrogynus ATCC 38327]
MPHTADAAARRASATMQPTHLSPVHPDSSSVRTSVGASTSSSGLAPASASTSRNGNTSLERNGAGRTSTLERRAVRVGPPPLQGTLERAQRTVRTSTLERGRQNSAGAASDEEPPSPSLKVKRGFLLAGGASQGTLGTIMSWLSLPGSVASGAAAAGASPRQKASRRSRSAANRSSASAMTGNTTRTTPMAALRTMYDTGGIYSLYRALMTLQAHLYLICAPFLLNLPIYSSYELRSLVTFVYIDLTLSEEAYLILYAFAATFLATGSIMHFIPDHAVLVTFGSWFARTGTEIFTVTRTVLMIPAIRFLASIWHCRLDEHGSGVVLVRGRFIDLPCYTPIHYAVAISGSLILGLFTLAVLHGIHCRLSPEEKAKARFRTVFDEDSRVYHQFSTIHSITTSLLLLNTTTPHPSVTATLLAMTLLSTLASLLFPPFYDERMRMAALGGVFCAVYTNLLGLLSWAYPYSPTLMGLFALSPLAATAGAYLARVNRQLQIRRVLNRVVVLSKTAGIPAGSKTTLGSSAAPSRMQLDDATAVAAAAVQKQLRALGQFPHAFRGAPALLHGTFLPRLNQAPGMHLVVLNLAHNWLTASDAVAVLRAVAPMRAVRELDLAQNRIGWTWTHHGDALVAFFRSSKVAALRLNKNPLGDTGVAAVARAIVGAENRCLRSLAIVECGVTARAARALAALVAPQAVPFPVDDEGESDGSSGSETSAPRSAAPRPGNAIVHPSPLTRLNLAGNRLGPDGMAVLAPALARSSVLRRLNLAWNHLGAAGFAVLWASVQDNSSLVEINLGSNGISVEQRKMVDTHLKRNAGFTHVRVKLSKKELLAQLGGEDGLQRIVHAFYIRLLQDEQLKHRFAGVTMHRMRHLQFHFLLFLFGGGENRYRGRSMREGHAHLQITNDEYDAVTDHLLRTIKDHRATIAVEALLIVQRLIENLREQIVQQPATHSTADDGSLAATDPASRGRSSSVLGSRLSSVFLRGTSGRRGSTNAGGALGTEGPPVVGAIPGTPASVRARMAATGAASAVGRGPAIVAPDASAGSCGSRSASASASASDSDGAASGVRLAPSLADAARSATTSSATTGGHAPQPVTQFLWAAIAVVFGHYYLGAARSINGLRATREIVGTLL